MNYQEVKQLLDAGFTAEEIRTMLNNPQNPQNNSQGQNADNEDPEQNTDNVDQVQNADNSDQDKPVETEQDKRFNQLNDAFERLIKTIQVSNLQASHVDNISKPDLDSEVDKIMAGVIRPERNKEE
jgi:DNA-binding transcriptional MerR regulator